MDAIALSCTFICMFSFDKQRLLWLLPFCSTLMQSYTNCTRDVDWYQHPGKTLSPEMTPSLGQGRHVRHEKIPWFVPRGICHQKLPRSWLQPFENVLSITQNSIEISGLWQKGRRKEIHAVAAEWFCYRTNQEPWSTDFSTSKRCIVGHDRLQNYRRMSTACEKSFAASLLLLR